MARAPTTPPRARAWGVALAVAQFNAEVTHAMRDDARRRAREVGLRVVVEAEAPGSYDLPLVVAALLDRPDVDAVVALGAIVRGETRHDEAIASASFAALSRLALASRKPVGLGVTGPGQTYAQAQARVDRAGAAVESVLKQLQTLASLRAPDDGGPRAQAARPRQRGGRPRDRRA